MALVQEQSVLLDGPFQSPARPLEADEGDVCWICLSGSESGELVTLCKCPRPTHAKCLARWQLQQAGREEEDTCRFCRARYPDWKASLTPPDVKPVTPVMAIKFEGRTYKLRVKPGPEGLKEFKNQVRELLGFDITEEFDVTFEAHIGGERIKLQGLNSYGAATHCAAITAAEREKRPHRSSRSRQAAVSDAGAAGGSAGTSGIMQAGASGSRSHREPGIAASAAAAAANPDARTHHFERRLPNRQRSRSASDLRPRMLYPGAPGFPHPLRPMPPPHVPAPAAAQPAAAAAAVVPDLPSVASQPLPQASSSQNCLSSCPSSDAVTSERSTGSSSMRSTYDDPSSQPAASGTVKLPILTKTASFAKKTINKLLSAWGSSHDSVHSKH